MYRTIKADEKHRKDINRLIQQAKIGSGFGEEEPVKNFWIVKNPDGKVVACCGLEFYNGNAMLTSLVVEKDHRHQGIGSALISHRLGIARKRKARLVALVTMYYHFNFYKRRGFRTCPRANLPESIKNYHQFTAKRYKKCAVMYRKI